MLDCRKGPRQEPSLGRWLAQEPTGVQQTPAHRAGHLICLESGSMYKQYSLVLKSWKLRWLYGSYSPLAFESPDPFLPRSLEKDATWTRSSVRSRAGEDHSCGRPATIGRQHAFIVHA